jgi:hypothetical protein
MGSQQDIITGAATMASEKKSAAFSFKSTGVTCALVSGGGGVNHINLEGTATGFGTVIGTLSFFADAPGAQSGRTSWVGDAYLDNGDQVFGVSEGFWEKSGKHKWRVRGLLRVSTGATYLSDGVVSLSGRTYKGTLSEWE